MAEKIKTLKLQTVPKLIIPIELPKDPENDGEEGETIILEFELRRQTPATAGKLIQDMKELTDAYHAATIDDMDYAQKMLGMVCEKTHWAILKKYDLIYIKQILDHIKIESERYKKKFSDPTLLSR